MKLRIAICIVLVLCLVGAFLLGGHLKAAYADELALRDSQVAQIAAQQQEVDELQAAVNELRAQQAATTTANAKALEQQAQEIQAQIEAVQAQIEETQAQIAQISTDAADRQAELERLQEEHSYFLEVYDELSKGLEMVKGYIAGN